MEKYEYPGFDRLEEDSPAKYSLPLCDILHSLIEDRDFAYISAAFFPLELTELILQYLKYSKGVNEAVIENFSKKYLTEDSLYPIDKLISLWGMEKFDQMIAELQALAYN